MTRPFTSPPADSFFNRKHRDKHLRPYICNQPECEKIPGFTYSGGLLRHEREVHRQHGGPKAPRFCPHKDCKRSTGQGFSRKENLNEHLRRVHRGHGIEKDDTPLAPIGSTHSPLMPSTDTNSSRKRRRDEESDDGDLIDYGTASRPELVNEIKRLKDELEQTRDRLSYVESLVTGNKPQGSRYKME